MAAHREPSRAPHPLLVRMEKSTDGLKKKKTFIFYLKLNNIFLRIINTIYIYKKPGLTVFSIFDFFSLYRIQDTKIKHGQTHSNFAGDAEKHGTMESTPDTRVEMKDCVLN
jgi:hypothetical protein